MDAAAAETAAQRKQLAERLSASEALTSGQAVELQAAQVEMAQRQKRVEQLEQCVAAAEAKELQSQDELRKVGSAQKELHAAKEESARLRELCQQLTGRVAELEAATLQNSIEVQQVHAERARLAERLGEAEAGVTAKVATAEAVAAESRAEFQMRMQAETQSLLIEKAVNKIQCEQLEQQLKALKAETNAKVDEIKALSEEKGRYKGLCHHLKQQLHVAKQPAGLWSRELPLHPSDEHSSICSETSWSLLGDVGSTSGISVDTPGTHCFMSDARFKAESGVLISANDLCEGSRILAADGKVVEVASPPTQHEAGQIKSTKHPATPNLFPPLRIHPTPPSHAQANKTVLLQAGAATLQVTLDHRVVLPGGSAAPWLVECTARSICGFRAAPWPCVMRWLFAEP